MKTFLAPARLAVLPLALAAAFPLHATAQSPSQAELDSVVVTATRTASRADALLSDVVVIDRKTIERHTGRTLAELITREAGVQMSANGGLGKNSSLYIRGTGNRHVLLLIDGVRFGSATTGAPSLDNLPVADIERIEVLKGPASALYGSDAIGGVIQIFTRRGREGLHPRVEATAGSHGRRELTVGLDGGTENVNYSVSVRRLREDGFSATNPTSSSYNADPDGFEQDSAHVSMGWKLSPSWKADAILTHADGTTRFDSGSRPFDVRSEVNSQVGSLGIEGRVADAWKTRLAWSRSHDKATNISSANSSSRFDTAQAQWLWQNEIVTPVGELLTGYEHLQQEIDTGSNPYPVSQRSVGSWFGGLHGSLGDHHWQLNARRDRNSQFGSVNTTLVAYGYQLLPQLRLHASQGSSFKAPTFNDLYYPLSWGYVGNPDVRPERGRNRELGAILTAGEHTFKAVRFANRIEDLIDWQPVGPVTMPVNIDRARIDGWTLSHEGQWGSFGLRSTLDLLDARNARDGTRLHRRADRQLTSSADYSVGKWRFGASLLAASDRLDRPGSTAQLAGFGTVDLHADYALSQDWSVQARVVNVGDKDYETARGFNQPGRAGYLSLRWQPR